MAAAQCQYCFDTVLSEAAMAVHFCFKWCAGGEYEKAANGGLFILPRVFAQRKHASLPAPVKNALESRDSEAFSLFILCDLSQWQIGGIGAKAAIAAW